MLQTVFQDLQTFYTTWSANIQHMKNLPQSILKKIIHKSFKKPFDFLRLLTTILVNTPGVNSATYLLRS